MFLCNVCMLAYMISLALFKFVTSAKQAMYLSQFVDLSLSICEQDHWKSGGLIMKCFGGWVKKAIIRL